MAEDGIRRKRGRPRKPRTFSDQLRERIQARIGWCSCCLRPVGSIAGAAKDAGVPVASLHQFLRRDKPLSGANIDKVSAWLDRS